MRISLFKRSRFTYIDDYVDTTEPVDACLGS